MHGRCAGHTHLAPSRRFMPGIWILDARSRSVTAAPSPVCGVPPIINLPCYSGCVPHGNQGQVLPRCAPFQGPSARTAFSPLMPSSSCARRAREMGGRGGSGLDEQERQCGASRISGRGAPPRGERGRVSLLPVSSGSSHPCKPIALFHYATGSLAAKTRGGPAPPSPNPKISQIIAPPLRSSSVYETTRQKA